MRLDKDPAVGLPFVLNCLYHPKTTIRRATMKTFKAICTAAILALALTVPAYAGDVETPGKPAPSPSPSKISTQESGSDPTYSELTADEYVTFSEFADIMWSLALML
jgi:hypothetical protein